jgi:hypothetical protein
MQVVALCSIRDRIMAMIILHTQGCHRPYIAPEPNDSEADANL